MLLIRGSVGPEVKELQRNLTEVGYPVTIDGTYGETTEEAVREFQAANDLAADGAYGPDTHEAMQEALAGEDDDDEEDDDEEDEEDDEEG
jgi:peptidoglycan hydrolase-like protein with peptidoglycan-binding domain